MSTNERRFPQSVYRRGTEPDPRFSLANERTFLTWISTSLGLVSAGVAVHSVFPNLDDPFTKAAGLVLIVAGILSPIQAWLGWMRDEQAMREDRPLPAPIFELALAIAVTIAAVLLLIGVLQR